ncbi:MAG: hypothetical protein Q9M37_09065 [Desulfonauticus sp.]|nr:hypothetical protein [Desulfonauticus sp.]
MVGPIDFPVLFSQIPQLQKLQHGGQSYPESAQNVLAEVVVQKQKEENKQILKPEKTEAQSKISPDKDKNRDASFHSKQKKKKSSKENKFVHDEDTKHLIDLQV